MNSGIRITNRPKVSSVFAVEVSKKSDILGARVAQSVVPLASD